MRELRDTERAALVKLLADDDPHVLDLLQENFLQMGADGLAFLELVAQHSDADAQRGARQILETLRERQAVDTFARFCGTCGSHFDLEQACWMLARTRYPALDVAPYHVRLAQMTQELRERLTSRETPRSTIEVCNHYLFKMLNFRGNREDYNDPDNSYLNRVLDRRLGIPISLSTVYLIIGQRLGLPLYGVNMPGHFLIKWQSTATQFYVDAFAEGRILSQHDCRELSERLGLAFSPASLTPASPRQIIQRMCRNLQSCFADTQTQRAEQLGRFVALLSRR
jgi:regulator of sirC expression with transglutaminase-like and TPR domain